MMLHTAVAPAFTVTFPVGVPLVPGTTWTVNSSACSPPTAIVSADSARLVVVGSLATVRVWAVSAEVAQAYRLLLDGDPAEAAQAWTRLGCTYDAAMALADAPDEAALREALGILTGLGARPRPGLSASVCGRSAPAPSRLARAQPP